MGIAEILYEMLGNNNLRKEIEQYKDYYSEILIGIHTDLNQYKQIVEENSQKVDEYNIKNENLILEISKKIEIANQIKKEVELKHISIKEIINSIIQKEEQIFKMMESINSTKNDLEEFKVTFQNIVSVFQQNTTEISSLKNTNKILILCISLLVVMTVLNFFLWK